MTDKITLSTVGSLIDATTAVNTINSNFTAIQTATDNTVSRDGTQPNSMNANLDMNSNRLLNLPAPSSLNEPVRLTDLNALTAGGTVTVNTMPTGGTTGQALEKNSNSNYDVSWQTIPVVIGIPSGGTTNQVLTKNTNTNYDVSWSSNASVILNGQSGALALTTQPQGRLTLTSGVQVNTTDVVGATTVYYTPAAGNQVPIYDGTNMVPTTFSEIFQTTADITKSPAAVANNSVYDIFVWNDAGTVRATRGPVWTNDTTRSAGTALTLVNGIWLNNATITNGPAAQRGTYVGSIRSNGTATIDLKFGTAAVGGGAAWFGVWNNNNRVPGTAYVNDTSGAWTVTTPGPGPLNASANNRISILHGLDEDAVTAHVSLRGISIAANSVQFGFGLDSISAFATRSAQSWSFAAADVNHVGTFNGNIGVGFHFLQALESATAGGQTGRQVSNAGGGATTCVTWW